MQPTATAPETGMTRTLVALLLACLAAAAMAAEPATDEINALSLYAGTRQVDHQGQPVNDSHLLNDGVATRHSQFEVSRTGEPTLGLVFQLAEPYRKLPRQAGHTTQPDRGTFEKSGLPAKGRIAGSAERPSLLRCDWRKLRQTAIAPAHQRLATPHQPPHTGAQGAVLVPVGRDGIRAKQPFGHLAQGRARQGRVKRLQGVQLLHRGERRP